MIATRFLLICRPAIRTSTRTISSAVRNTAPRTPLAFRRTGQQSPHLRLTFPRAQQRVDWQKTWNRGQQRGYRRQAFNYQRFQTTQSYLRAWAARPTFYYEVGGIGLLCGGFYIYNLEPVPVSGRRRFNIVSSGYEAQMGQQMYAQTMQEFNGRILAPHTKEHRMVQRVLGRLVPNSGLEGEAWEVNVIDDKMQNAFVIPGGKVFVFRGILDVCQNDDGLAAVLGHEIAHNVAHHAAERMSQSLLVWPVLLVSYTLFGVDLGISRFLLNLAFTLPGSRSQEEEADYIGLQIMAKSCYPPQAAAGLWSRMEKEEQVSPPQFLSTHPSSHNRLGKIQGWLPEAEMQYANSECGVTGSYVADFKSVADFSRW